jgi:hypothetical protein
MIRSTAPRLTALPLSLLVVLAMAASGPAVAVRVSAAQPPAAPTPPDDASWPPPGVHRQTESGVTLPAAPDVGPRDTSEASTRRFRARSARGVVEPTHGDACPRRAIARQARSEAAVGPRNSGFTAGTKDNATVPVLITIDMAFTLGDAPPPFTWPEPFVAEGDPVVDSSGWIEEESDESGLRIRVARPNSWIVRKDGPGSGVLSLRSASGNGPRILFIEKPKPARFQVGRSLTAELLQQVADTTRQGMTPAGAAEVMGVGQMRLADRVWIWVDLWLPALDMSRMRPALSGLAPAVFDGARMWTFITIAGSQEIAVGCVALRSRTASASSGREELRQAGTAAMLRRRFRSADLQPARSGGAPTALPGRFPQPSYALSTRIVGGHPGRRDRAVSSRSRRRGGSGVLFTPDGPILTNSPWSTSGPLGRHDRRPLDPRGSIGQADDLAVIRIDGSALHWRLGARAVRLAGRDRHRQSLRLPPLGTPASSARSGDRCARDRDN